jgi:hypothetical protein
MTQQPEQLSVKSSWFNLCFAVAACCASQASAQLSWDTRQLDFHPKPEELVVKGEFAFTNIGKAPITITDVKTSCGCTTAALTKKVYAPGEKGAIATTFTMGDRTGLQQKQVVVRTDYPEEMFIQLTVRVFIPEFLKLEPQIIRWPLNSKNEVRTFKLNAGTDQTIKVLGVRSTDDRIFAKLKTIEPGKRYEVEVSVNGTTEPLRGFVRVETDFPAQKPKAYNLPVEIGDAPRPVPPANALTGAPPFPLGSVPPGFAPGLLPTPAAPSVVAPPVAAPAAGTPPAATPAVTVVTAPRPVVATPAAPARAATPGKRTK